MLKLHPVGNLRQRVRAGQELDAILGAAALGAVLRGDDPALGLIVLVAKLRNRIGDRQRCAVASRERAVAGARRPLAGAHLGA